MSIVATFVCDSCGSEAARVAFFPKGEVNPHSLFDRGLSDNVSILDFLAPAVTHNVSADRRTELAAALERGDGKQLYDVHFLWAPFYCPDCGKIYCRSHWTTIPQMADDFPGFYDCTVGFCPENHERVVDD